MTRPRQFQIEAVLIMSRHFEQFSQGEPVLGGQSAMASSSLGQGKGDAGTDRIMAVFSMRASWRWVGGLEADPADVGASRYGFSVILHGIGA